MASMGMVSIAPIAFIESNSQEVRTHGLVFCPPGDIHHASGGNGRLAGSGDW